MLFQPKTRAQRNARANLRAGLQIIPLVPNGKKPLNPGGCRSPIEKWSELAHYAESNPDLNYGILTGQPNDLVVIDVDGPEGEASLKQLQDENEPLPKTITVQTGRGRHLYFSSENPALRCRTSVRDGIDLRANGGYIVGPGSEHKNGVTYSYAPRLGPDEVECRKIPAWLESVLLAPNAAPASATPASEGPKKIVEGQRNSHLTAFAGRLHNKEIAQAVLFAAVKAENQGSCTPPLSDDEVRVICDSIGRYDVHLSVRDPAERVMERVLAEYFADGDHLLYASDGNFWAFEATHWKVLSKARLSKIVLKTIRSMPERDKGSTSTVLQQALALIGAHCAEAGDQLRFHCDPPLAIACRNCELWIGKDGAIDRRVHSAKSYLRHSFDVDYDPAASCPLYDQALLEIFSKTEAPEEMAAFWNDLVGYIMQPLRPRPMIVIGKGTGSNGKTALVQLAVRLLGQDLVSAIPVRDIEKNQFAIGGLDGKLLLLDDDVVAGTKLPDGQLKKVSEAKILTGEHKYGPAFQFKIRTVPLMLCNNMPTIADLSHGLRRRLIVVPFDRQFSESEAKVDLFQTISSTEMSGVFNRYLAGLIRVIRANWLVARAVGVQAATAEFIAGANPVTSFLEEECETQGRALVKELFEAYTQWCAESGITHAQQRQNFTKNLKNLGFEIRHGNKGDVVHGLRRRAR